MYEGIIPKAMLQNVLKIENLYILMKFTGILHNHLIN